MPKTLYDKKKEKGQGKALQGEDGLLAWAQRYRLTDGANQRKSSKHKFMVPTNSVFRLFVDTNQSGALVKYRLLNDQKAELLSSVGSPQDVDEDGFVDSGSEILLLHQPQYKEPSKAPFTLQLEFRHIASPKTGQSGADACAVLDIRLVVEPLLTAQAALKCSEKELAEAAEQRAISWQFDDSTRFEKQSVVIRSDDTKLFKHDDEELNNFAMLRYKIAVGRSGNALSVVATYPFSSVLMTMSLID